MLAGKASRSSRPSGTLPAVSRKFSSSPLGVPKNVASPVMWLVPL